MNNLSFDWDVFISNLFFGNLNILNLFFRHVLGNILSEIFDSVIISNCNFFRNCLNFPFLFIFHFFNFFWHSLHFCLVLVFDHFLLKRNIFNSTFSFYHFFSSINCCSNNLSSSSYHSGRSRNYSSSNSVVTSSIINVLRSTSCVNSLSRGDWYCSILIS